MKERPILFNADMVRAILSGQKTQTRRLVKSKHLPWLENSVINFLDGKWNQRPLPYGSIGDRLWLREAYAKEYDYCDHPEMPGCPTEYWHIAYHYRADGEQSDTAGCLSRGYPSIHMPRAASRITLEITGVRVERLQDISDDDAKAEGFNYSGHPSALATGFSVGARTNFRHGWDACYGAGSWDANPWVWVIEFKCIGEAME